MRHTIAFVLLLQVSLAGLVQASEPTLHLLPAEIALRGPESLQKLVIETAIDETFVGPVEGEANWSVEDPSVCRIERGIVYPAANGTTKIVATVGDRQAFAMVSVSEMDAPFQWSFRNHVQSVLAKSGCNSGACHGAAAGKRGFKLSLRGYDAFGDFDALLRQADGRRINLEEPSQSLLLTKATAAVPHGGGKRVDVDSRNYRVLADWVASGAVAPALDDARIERVEILPPRVRLAKGKNQPLIVLAHFSDGRVEDVTAWTKYTSASADVAEVDEEGIVKIVGFGEGAISAWYQNKIALATVTAPYPNPVDAQVYVDASRRNLIDDLVLGKLAQLSLPPSPMSSDETFIRRAYLDTIGTLPTPEEVIAFRDDPSTDKRDKLIESLFVRPEFVDYWTYRFCDLLLVNSEKLRPAAMWAYYDWVRSNVAAGRRWDEMVRDLVTAQGSTLENGATNFYVLHQDTRELTESVSVAFMGLSINCARCHNHPLERWTNDEYFGLANMFARVRLKGAPGDGHFTVVAAREGDLVQPLRGKPQTPRPLDGQSLPIDDPSDRRVALAKWLTSPENPYFARAITNRIWANFMGVGIVEPVDDLRLTNPPSHPELLDALAAHLVEHEFDLRSLMRLILQSSAYQRSSDPAPGNEQDKRFYSRYYPKRLMAEVMIDALAKATGVPTPFPGYPADWRAIQLPDSKVASTFLDKFGRPKRDATCECERTNAPSMVQALHIANGDSLNQKLQQPSSRAGELMAMTDDPPALVNRAYLVSLCRLPSDEERAAFVREMAGVPESDRRAFVEDLLWSLLSSNEFLFNH